MLAWIDLEMTGLDPARHTIVEIACLITDDDLTLIEEGPDLVVHATPEQLADMDDVVRAMHTRSGLLADIEASTLTLAEAGAQTLAFLQQHIPQPRTVPLAGNSIGTDRRFLAQQLPEIEDYLHYRSVDVSTVKELCRRWRPEVYKAAPAKKGGHRALQDIRESVAELAYYRAAMFDTSRRRDRRRAGEDGGRHRNRRGDTVTPSDSPSMSIAEANAALTAPGQIFEMEERDIRGIPTRTWKNAPPNLRAVIDMSLAHGDAVFLVYEDERTTFAEHYRIACTLAHRLRTTFGVEQGDRVAIIMRNLPEWVMAFWAATLAGAIVVPLNAWWSGEELRYGLEDSGSKVAFVDTQRAERVRPFLGGLDTLKALIVADEHRTPAEAPLAVYEPTGGAALVPEWPFPLALGDVDEAASPPDLTLDPEDDATIFYTSGTTGRPKGAVGTHRNMCTNLMSLFFLNTRGGMRFGSSPFEETANRPNGPSPPFLLSVPLFHATGCHSIMVTNIAAGGKLVMMHHWDPERALELIERERIATFGGVPAMVMQVLDSPNFKKFDTSSIRGVSYGGAPAPPDLVRRIREAWPIGQPSNGYGLTETSSVTSMNSGADYVAKPDSAGPPVPVCDVAVLPEDYAKEEPDDSVPRGPGVRGELWIKGPNVVRGYWNRPEETAKTFSRGWLHTGDVAQLDDENFIYIVDRAKDMIIRGGENVYSVQVEAALFEHPAVADVAVIGVPEPTLGEEVGAVVVLRPGTKVTADELALHVKARLAGFMVPTHIWFRSEPLPRNPQGKVLKRELREELVGSK